MATPIKTDRLSFLEQELKNLEEQGSSGGREPSRVNSALAPSSTAVKSSISLLIIIWA
jgi:hypothetical protein